MNAVTNWQYQELKNLKDNKNKENTQTTTITTPAISLQQLFYLYVREISGDFLKENKQMDTMTAMQTGSINHTELKEGIQNKLRAQKLSTVETFMIHDADGLCSATIPIDMATAIGGDTSKVP